MKMDRKSQAAVEFLMTYGWAILLAVVAISALTSFGALDPLVYFSESKCKIYGNFYCDDFKIDESNQQVTVVLRNKLGFNAKDVTVKMNSENCFSNGEGGDQLTQGTVHAANDITVSGSDNTINGGILYSTTFTNSGSGNVYDPEPEQYAGSLPEPFDIEDYSPGGSAAIEAQAEGKYTEVIGDFRGEDSGIALDGLYYVTGNVKLSGSDISGIFTIVAEGNIEISGSDQNGISYTDNLLFFSNAAGNDAIKLSGSGSSFEGYFYAPNGEIRESGSGNNIDGGFLSSQVKLSGSRLTVTYVPISSGSSDPSILQLQNPGDIPNPWVNGQTVYLNFTCLGTLQRR